ncbi:MAG TPA: hypothetical protein VH640_27500, partial [Bryobacteraceae bacterium]
KTVSDASNMPTESQINAIQSHLDGRVDGRLMRAPILTSYCKCHGRKTGLQPTANILQGALSRSMCDMEILRICALERNY